MDCYTRISVLNIRKEHVKPHEVWGVPKRRGGFSTFSETLTSLKLLNSFAIISSTARTSSVMTALGYFFLWKLFLVLNSLFTFIVFPLTSVSLSAVDWSCLLSPQSYMRHYLNFDANGQSSAFVSSSAEWLLQAHIRLDPDYPAQSRATVLEGRAR